MDIFFLVMLAYFSYRNSIRAKQKKKNPLLWGFITAGTFLATLLIGFAVVVFYFCRNIIDINRLGVDPKYQEVAVKLLNQAFIDNPLHLLTVYLFGIGGYLIIRYILDQKPGEKEPEVHWMDRMGEQ